MAGTGELLPGPGASRLGAMPAPAPCTQASTPRDSRGTDAGTPARHRAKAGLFTQEGPSTEPRRRWNGAKKKPGRGAGLSMAAQTARSGAAGHHQLLDLRDRQGRVQALRAGPRAVHDGVATVQLERVLEVVQARTGVLVARVHDPAVGLQQDRRAQVALAAPPVARAAGRAAGAREALVQAVQLLAVLRRLRALAVRRRRRLGAVPGLDRGVLRVEVGQVRDQVLDHV